MSNVARVPAFLLLFSACAGVGLASTGCASGKREPLVPDETQQRSEDRYGQQSQMMNSLNQTPSEQAGARHENGTRPVEREDEPSRESREQ
jgi:hypothetical protein